MRYCKRRAKCEHSVVKHENVRRRETCKAETARINVLHRHRTRKNERRFVLTSETKRKRREKVQSYTFRVFFNETVRLNVFWAFFKIFNALVNSTQNRQSI